MKISIAADHGGYLLKQEIIKHLTEKNIEVMDYGTNSPKSVDYPEYSYKVCGDVVAGKTDYGVLVCGTGIGMSIAANKTPGIRAALVGDVFSAQATRSHNNTNVLCLGERVTGKDLALLIVDTWLDTDFSGGRHQRRIDLLE